MKNVQKYARLCIRTFLFFELIITKCCHEKLVWTRLLNLQQQNEYIHHESLSLIQNACMGDNFIAQKDVFFPLIKAFFFCLYSDFKKKNVLNFHCEQLPNRQN
jgi:hypothetical protein